MLAEEDPQVEALQLEEATGGKAYDEGSCMFAIKRHNRYQDRSIGLPPQVMGNGSKGKWL